MIFAFQAYNFILHNEIFYYNNLTWKLLLHAKQNYYNNERKIIKLIETLASFFSYLNL
jgi:hypothetical protein